MSETAFSGRRAYRDLGLYKPDRTFCRIDLSDNTNAWGMPPEARRALADASSFARYPSLYADDLKDALSDYTGVPASMISTGCGSDDVLDSALRAFAEPGDAIAYPEPTFPAIPIFARMNSLVPVPVPMSAGYDLDAKAMLSARSRIIYACSPNNPTGNAIPKSTLEELVQRLADDQILIIDEAYAEFAGVSAVDLIESCDRLIITRTMSKAFGLAGLRIGYALGNATLIAEVEKSRGPYKVSAAAERAAYVALTQDRAWVNEHVDLVLANRARLEGALRERGLCPIPSAANFVFFPIDNAIEVARCMRAVGVAVRAFAEPSGLRITVGTWPQIEEALAAFDEARRECA